MRDLQIGVAESCYRFCYRPDAEHNRISRARGRDEWLPTTMSSATATSPRTKSCARGSPDRSNVLTAARRWTSTCTVGVGWQVGRWLNRGLPAGERRRSWYQRAEG